MRNEGRTYTHVKKGITKQNEKSISTEQNGNHWLKMRKNNDHHSMQPQSW
jgi:hypothetical protein